MEQGIIWGGSGNRPTFRRGTKSGARKGAQGVVINEEVALTVTIDVLKAIAEGDGPNDGTPQKRPSSGVFGRDTAGNHGRETDEFEISVPYPPTVSAGGFSDPSFCTFGENIAAVL